MDKSESIMKLAEALSKAQGMIKGAIRDAENPFFHAAYADLASVWEACRIPLSVNGLSVTQVTEMDGDKLTLVTMLLHNSGEYICGRYPIVPLKQDPQAYGSALTYSRRYSLSAIVGIAPEDDDGEATVGREKTKPEAKKPKEKPPEPPKEPFTFDNAMKRMEEIKTIFELRNWWTKHFPEIQTLDADAQRELTAYKDHLKAMFETPPEKVGE